MCPSVTIKIMNFLIKKVKFTNKFFSVYGSTQQFSLEDGGDNLRRLLLQPPLVFSFSVSSFSPGKASPRVFVCERSSSSSCRARPLGKVPFQKFLRGCCMCGGDGKGALRVRSVLCAFTSVRCIELYIWANEREGEIFVCGAFRARNDEKWHVNNV